jgi:predicted metal-dependent phosphotriesterase family hydrolase
MTDYEDETFDYGLAPGESFDPDEKDEPFDLSLPHIMTALGPIDPGSFGFALSHEHLFCRPITGIEDPDFILDDASAAVTELEYFFAGGGRGLVDMSTTDYGRDIAEMRWIAQHAPVHIVLTAGHHKELFAEAFIAGQSTDEVMDAIVQEVTEGIEGTAIRAGVIKAGSSLDAITPIEEKAFRAAARAHLITGAPISTHTERATMALEQIEILRSEGVAPERIVIGHMDRLLEEHYLRQVLETGVFIGFDGWSKWNYAPDEERAAMTKRLVDLGFGGQILLSGDLARRSLQIAHGGGPGLLYFADYVPLLLMAADIDAPTVRQLFVDNPARAFTSIRP